VFEQFGKALFVTGIDPITILIHQAQYRFFGFTHDLEISSFGG